MGKVTLGNVRQYKGVVSRVFACFIEGRSERIQANGKEFWPQNPQLRLRATTHIQYCFDAKTISQVLLCISAESRGEVDGIVSKAAAAGGVADPSPKDEYDFMYGRSFEDPDGHLWGVNWMDMEAFSAQFATENA